MSTAMTATTIYSTEIVYDLETRQYAMYLRGRLVGFARTHHDAEVALDQLIFELISGHYFATDPGGPPPPGDASTATLATVTVPDDTDPDDYSDVPAGPGEPE